MNGQEIYLISHSQPNVHICIKKGLNQINSKLFPSTSIMHAFIHSLPYLLSVYRMPGMILGPKHTIAKKVNPCPCAFYSLMRERERENGAVMNAIKRKKLTKGTFFQIAIHMHITNRKLFISNIYNVINQLLCIQTRIRSFWSLNNIYDQYGKNQEC